MESNVTVIIPAIKNSDILKHTIAKCLDLKCKVKLIVVTDDNTNRHFENDSRVEYIIVNPGLNMSTKRNLAVKNTDSEYIVFFDSDSYPENSETIKNAIQIMGRDKMIYAVGGPDISPPEQDFWNQIVGLVTKSFLISGFRNYRKNIQAEKYVKELSSCNLVMKRSRYLEFNGMNEDLYTSEDTDLFNRIINKGYKLFYSPRVLAHHRDRSLKSFLIQRYVRGAQTTHATVEYCKRLIRGQNITSGEYRLEYLLTPFLSIYIIFYVIIFFFNSIIFLYNIPFILFLLIIFLESLRLTRISLMTLFVFLTLALTSLVQSFASLTTFLNINFDLKKIYRNDNDK